MITNLSPLKAIRAKCLDCVCNQAIEVRRCVSKNCPLWPYRFGHNPNRAGIGSHSFPSSKGSSSAENGNQTED